MLTKLTGETIYLYRYFANMIYHYFPEAIPVNVCGEQQLITNANCVKLQCSEVRPQTLVAYE